MGDLDKELIKNRFTKALQQYDRLAVVQADIAKELADMLSSVVGASTSEVDCRHDGGAGDCGGVRCGLEIGSGSGFLTRHLVAQYPDAQWIFNDITAESQGFLPRYSSLLSDSSHSSCHHSDINIGLGSSSSSDWKFLCADGEFLDVAVESLDLVASASTIQWFSDIEGFIGRISCGLRNGGVLALATFGPQNFREITRVVGRGLSYPTVDEIAKWCLDSGLEVLCTRSWTQAQVFDTPIDVLRHIKATGVNSVVAERWTRSQLSDFQARYAAAYQPVTLTFEPIIVIARRPTHER